MSDLDPLFHKDPFEQFRIWFDEAVASQYPEPNAMTLSTVTADGRPDARIVLLKGVSDGQFQFFTNYQSRKSLELSQTPFASLVFFWPLAARQIRIEGAIEKLPDAVSDAYFISRPRGSQIGAWASIQSQECNDRSEIEKRFQEFEKKFEGKSVPRPAHWGGWGLKPDRFEFWIGRDSRLHDRCRYALSGGAKGSASAWSRARLYP